MKNYVVTLNQYGIFYLCALKNLLGKLNLSSTFSCAWTIVSKNHLKSERHTCTIYMCELCEDINFLHLQNDVEEILQIIQ